MHDLLLTHLNGIYPYALAPLISGLIILINSLNLIARDHKSIFARYFFYLCVSITLWNFACAFMMSAPDAAIAEYYLIPYWIGWFMVPILFLNLITRFLLKKNTPVIILSAVYIGLCSLIIFTGCSSVQKHYFGYFPRLLYPLNYVVMFPYVVTCLYGMVMLYRDYILATSKTRRNLLRLLWIGSSIGFLASIHELYPLLSERQEATFPGGPLALIAKNEAIFLLNVVAYLILLPIYKKFINKKRKRFTKIGDLEILMVVLLPWCVLDVYLVVNHSHAFYPVSSLGIIISTLTFSFAILKYRLFDVGEFVKQMLMYMLVSLAFVMVYVFFIGLFSRFTDDLTPFVVFVFLVIILLNPLNLRLQRLVNRKMFHHRYDYQETIMNSSKRLVTILDYNRLLMEIKHSIVGALESSTMVLLLYNYENDIYEVATAHGLETKELPTFNFNDQVIKLIILMNQELFRTQLEVDSEKGEFQEIISFFDLFQAELIIPLTYKNVLRGILCLGARETGQMYYQRDVDLLQILANQAVIAIDNARLYEMAIRDELTDLYILRFFNNRIVDEINNSIRLNQEFSLLMIDIDHFKSVNDTYGHQVGDQILRQIATTIRSQVRASDVVARYGGEEFAVILPRSNNQRAQLTAERIRESVAKKAQLQEIFRTVSVGVATVDSQAVTKQSKIIQNMTIAQRNLLFEHFKGIIIKHADEALYQAKNSGRNTVVNYGILRLEIPESFLPPRA